MLVLQLQLFGAMIPQCTAEDSLNYANNIILLKTYESKDYPKGILNIRQLITGTNENVTIDINWVYMNSQNPNNLKLTIDSVNTNFRNNNIPLHFNLKNTKSINERITLDPYDCVSHNLLYSKYGDKSSKIMNIFSGTINNDNTAFTKFPQPGNSTNGIFLGDMENHNLTKTEWVNTLTHEFGHWFGLLHTFQNGCNATTNDYVPDTKIVNVSPRAKTIVPGLKFNYNNLVSGTWKCDQKVDTCTDQPGNDLINNYMDYTLCQSTFTQGQSYRIMMFAYFRYFGKMVDPATLDNVKASKAALIVSLRFWIVMLLSISVL